MKEGDGSDVDLSTQVAETPPYQHLNDGAPGNLNDLDAMEQDAERAKATGC